MISVESLNLPKGLTYKDEEQVLAKLRRFLGQANSIHVVADFDRTLTERRPGTNEDTTSWNILRDHLPPDGLKICENLFATYRPKELAGTMTLDDAATWWSTILDTYTLHRLNLAEVEEDFLSRARARTGTEDFFSLCQEIGAPTVILSAGVKDVIDLWSRVYKISPTLVISTEFILNESMEITGWKKDTLVHSLNKSETDHPELNRIRNERPLSIVFGDSINDADMAIGDEDVLRIRIFDPRPDEVVDIQAERAKTFERFDLMIENGSLEPLTQLLRTLAKT